MSDASPTTRRSTQRERLLGGMTAVAAAQGFVGATVSKVIAHAGVSRPTFYEYFADRDECFLAAVAEGQRALLDAVRGAIDAGPPARAARTALQAVVEFARREPASARVLMSETLAGGARAMEARAEAIGAAARIVDEACGKGPPETAFPDLSSSLMIGGVFRLLAPRLRHGDQAQAGLVRDLHRWLDSYACPPAEHRWRSMTAAPSGARAPSRESQLLAPPPLARGRPRLSREEVAHNQRQRILFAVAQVAERSGYRATTVAEIIKVAGVDQRAFYRLFVDKQQAFAAAHELYFQHVMAVTASAFFAGDSWPERVWEAARGLAHAIEATPTLAHLGLVEVHAAGPTAVQRLEDSITAFTLFLQEGYRFGKHPTSPPPSRVALEAIAATSFELAYDQVRRRTGGLSGYVPHLTHLSLAPFLGPSATSRFLDARLAAVGAPAVC